MRFLTPDSLALLAGGQISSLASPQDSFDKQYVRDYLEEIRWNKQPRRPALPAEVASRTSQKYVRLTTRLRGVIWMFNDTTDEDGAA